jgi:hypothetical protein
LLGEGAAMPGKNPPTSVPDRAASKNLDQSFLNTANRTKVSPELLLEVLKMHNAMSPQVREVFEMRIIRIYKLLKSKDIRSERKIADLATAINFRLTALARLQQVDALRGWSIPGEKPGVASIALEILQASAAEPLIESL